MLRILFACLFIPLIPLVSFALHDEVMRDLVVQADKLEMNLKDNKAYLKGNVKVDSDAISIKAGGVEVVFSKSNSSDDMQNLLADLDKISSFRIYSDGQKIDASLDTKGIHYSLVCEEILGDLIGGKIYIHKANLKQDKNEFVGDKITYDMNSKQLMATSNSKRRVKISIQGNGSKTLK